MSRHFTITELTRSSTAAHRGIDNTPPPEIKTRLAALAKNLLDPIRERWGGPITVNSGFRCPVLNKAVGGSANSQHMRGEAADITVGSQAKNKQLFEMIRSMIEAREIAVGQLLWEKGDDRGPAWVHVSMGTKNEIKRIK